MKSEEKKVLVVETDQTLSENERKRLIAAAHEDLGHASVEVTYLFISEKNKWEGMKKEIKAFIESCSICQEFKDRAQRKVIYRIPIGGPFDRIGIDIVGPLPRTTGGNRYIVIATDYLTRWAEAKALKRKTEAEIVKFLINEIFLRHGAPNQILSDQGREFSNKLVKAVCEKFNSLKSFTSSYHPQCNGAVERLNRTLVAKLACICKGVWYDWDEKLPWAIHSYRISTIRRLKASPFKMLFGREPRGLESREYESSNTPNENEELKKIEELRNSDTTS